MSEKTAIYVLNQIYDYLERTGHIDNERRTALELAMKSLNGTTEFQLKTFVEHMMKLQEDTNAGEIKYEWEMKDGRKISLCFTVQEPDN